MYIFLCVCHDVLQEPVERRVIEHGLFVKHQKVEVYLLQLKLCSFADVTRVVTKHFSHATTIGEYQIIQLSRLFSYCLSIPICLLMFPKLASQGFSKLLVLIQTVCDLLTV